MIIGISGKSGSGKSKLANDLAVALNATVISFDIISHQALETESLKNLIKTQISSQVFDSNGNIIRKKLGEIVFSDPEKLKLINNHSEKIMEQIIDELLRTNPKPHVILEYALLPMMKYFNMCNFKILITANEAIRFERIINRDGISEEYFKKRESNSPTYIPALFDIIVENNSNEELSVDRIVNLIRDKEKSC